MKDLLANAEGAHQLQDKIVDAVFQYVNEDARKTHLGLYAAVRASISLIKSSNMSSQTRMSLAQSIFFELTDDIFIAQPDQNTESR